MHKSKALKIYYFWVILDSARLPLAELTNSKATQYIQKRQLETVNSYTNDICSRPACIQNDDCIESVVYKTTSAGSQFVYKMISAASMLNINDGCSQSVWATGQYLQNGHSIRTNQMSPWKFIVSIRVCVMRNAKSYKYGIKNSNDICFYVSHQWRGNPIYKYDQFNSTCMATRLSLFYVDFRFEKYFVFVYLISMVSSINNTIQNWIKNNTYLLYGLILM